MRDVGVVVTGLLRSLLSPPVAKTYEQHVVAPLSSRLDTFIVVVDNTTSRALLREQVAVAYPTASLIVMPERVHNRLSCAIRGTRVDWASANPRDMNASQKLRAIDRDQGRMVAHASRVLLQGCFGGDRVGCCRHCLCCHRRAPCQRRARLAGVHLCNALAFSARRLYAGRGADLGSQCAFSTAASAEICRCRMVLPCTLWLRQGLRR
jgi:hypothetical protein